MSAAERGTLRPHFAPPELHAVIRPVPRKRLKFLAVSDIAAFVRYAMGKRVDHRRMISAREGPNASLTHKQKSAVDIGHRNVKCPAQVTIPNRVTARKRALGGGWYAGAGSAVQGFVCNVVRDV